MSDEDAEDYEARRRANIERNKKLLAQLELRDYALRAETEIGGRSASPAQKRSRSHHARTKKKRLKQETGGGEDAKEHYDLRPLRSSARLRGIPAESKEAQIKREEDDMEAQRQAERARLTRLSGDLDVGKMTNGISYKEAQSLLSTFKDVKDTLAPKEGTESTNPDIRKTSSELSNLKLHQQFTPNEIKLTPERIYYMGFHPTADKKIILGGDKVGNLGIWNADQVRTISSGDGEDDDEEPEIVNFKIHSRTISSFVFDTINSQNLYTSSYDGSIRCFDLVAGKSTEVYFPTSDYYEDEAISIVDSVEPHILYFSTLEGRLYCKDTREKPSKFQKRLRCHGKKIGGMALNPSKPYQVLTASLDRTMKLWDLRELHKSTILSPDDEEDPNIQSPSLVAQYESRLSISAVSWNSHNKAVCNGYDDTINIFDLSKITSPNDNDNEQLLKPSHRIRHNCQTGRWVTILRAQWQHHAPDGVDKFIIGDMNRSMDIYSGTGELLARLADPDLISAVPAACNLHPTMNWAVGGTASGKVCLYY